jgi:hypothetical protein
MKKQFYEYTTYPKIYKNTYWGRCRCDDNDLNSDLEIIENRNKFIDEYNIKKTAEMSSKIRLDLNKSFYREPTTKNEIIDFKRTIHHWNDIDHLEIYKARDNKFVIVSSPYQSSLDEKVINHYNERGWSLIYNLYHKHALSFCKVYE